MSEERLCRDERNHAAAARHARQRVLEQETE
jgi:hypothetical protein